MKLQDHKSIYCLGIGGIGVSAVARLLHQLGKNVAGADVEKSSITDQLVHEGIKVHIGTHTVSAMPKNVDLVVYSNAVKENNSTLRAMQKRGIATASYPAMLALLMEKYITLLVAGTHGKSTTAAMLTSIFIAAKLDPTVVIGTQMDQLNGNARLGLGRHFIAEGDEYRAAFLHYRPIGLIINNIEADHLDFYKTERGVIKAFTSLVRSVPHGGHIVANADDKNVEKIVQKAKCKVITFGKTSGDYYVNHIIHHGELTRFAVRGLEEFELAIRVPGEHNVLNALAASVLALTFGISITAIQQGLLSFTGVWRRFEIKGEKRDITIIDDYAHHPTEIKATLHAARQLFPKKKIWCVFQPHSTHRTKSLYKDFIPSFVDCDALVLTDVYRVAGRETQDAVMMKKMAADVSSVHQDVQYLKTFTGIARMLKREAQGGDVIITMGAGTITELSDTLLKKI